MTSPAVDSEHASGLHELLPHPACAECLTAAQVAADKKRRADNRALTIGLLCMILGFALAVALIAIYA